LRRGENTLVQISNGVIPSAKNHTSDALSHHPVGITNPDIPDDDTMPNAACPYHKPTIRILITLLAGQSTANPTEVDDKSLASAMCTAIAGISLDWEWPPLQTKPSKSLRL
jgi:hypothetical protein